MEDIERVDNQELIEKGIPFSDTFDDEDEDFDDEPEVKEEKSVKNSRKRQKL